MLRKTLHVKDSYAEHEAGARGSAQVLKTPVLWWICAIAEGDLAFVQARAGARRGQALPILPLRLAYLFAYRLLSRR